jgi:GGDEF domain-containing protein
VGGDDFVILTDPGMAEAIAADIAKRFDDAMPALYDAPDRERGWIESEERNGNQMRTPLVSVSIGIVIAEPGRYTSAAALASRAAEVKGVAKRMPGSKWILDRRRPPERFS